MGYIRIILPEEEDRLMPPHRKPVKKRRTLPFHWTAIAIPAAVVLFLTIVSFSFAASMEENNAFCASCHTQPETTYYASFQAAGAPTDLAAFHNTKQTKCIDCHSGEGTGGRIDAILQGAHNAVAFYTRTARQPGTLTSPFGDGNCLKCHRSITDSNDFNNHFHNLLPRWQAADPNAAGCVSCHTSHPSGRDPKLAFLDQTQTDRVCQRCHNSQGGE
jgi:predicted CXXCH cytochrome family protein